MNVVYFLLFYIYIDGLVQERRNSIDNALGLHLSCTNPSLWYSFRIRTKITPALTRQIPRICLSWMDQVLGSRSLQGHISMIMRQTGRLNQKPRNGPCKWSGEQFLLCISWNSLWPSDPKQHHKRGLILNHIIMACCLMAPNFYINSVGFSFCQIIEIWI